MMDKKEISQIIELVFALAAKTVSRLKAEKKATGDYSKTVTFEEKGYEIQFEALQYRGGYPPISVNLTFSVTVSLGGRQLMLFHVMPIKSRYDYFLSRDNRDDKFKIWAVVCDKSKVKPLFRSGDTICIANNQKAAFAKAEILSEEIEYTRFADTVTRKLRMTKELGHPETLAYETGYPAEVATYVADESTEEYFGGKKTLEKDIEVYCKLEPVEQDGLVWYEYIREVVSSNSSIDLTTPLTEAEVTMRLKEKALERLLEDCRGEFCYGDPRVQNYKKHYLILGEALIDRIHDVYLAWLKENCTTFAQDAQSGEFTGIAIDWNGKEDYQPNFNIQDDEVKIEYYDDLWEKQPLTPYRDFLILSYWINRHLDTPYDDLQDFFRNAASNGKVCLTLFKLGYDPRSVASFFSELTTDLENVFVDAIKKIGETYETYADDYDEYERECKTLLGQKND